VILFAGELLFSLYGLGHGYGNKSGQEERSVYSDT
jgi:hypothetical protein